MTGNILNSLQYAGTVTLSLQPSGSTAKKQIFQNHNAGTSKLFNFFTDCLAGDWEMAKTERPVKIMLLKASIKNEKEVEESLSDFLHLATAQPEKIFNETTKGEAIRFSFIVPKAMLTSGFNRIGLYADSVTYDHFRDYSAYCDINLADGANRALYGSSSVLVVDWDLHISNSSVG